jgi:pyrroline-5-carboxylate reductase
MNREQSASVGRLADKRLAILGVGIMGSAFARGLVHSGALGAARLVLYDSHHAKAEAVAAELNHEPTVADSVEAAVRGADIVLISTKPPIVADVLRKMAPLVSARQLVVSIAAGVRLEKMETLLSQEVPMIRVMPNTAATVNQAATAMARGSHACDEHIALAMEMFEAVGKAVEVEEKLMDAVTGLSGSGPAYVFMLIEALMDGGVKAGLNRDTARLLAAQTVFGAAKMVLESDTHPAQLKDNVTTPGGTTIAALAVLERAGLRTALIDAIEAATERSRELS